MKLNHKLAEIAGMFAADGSMQKQHICMWGNIIEDKEYYDIYLAPLFSQFFDKKLNIHEKRSNSVYGFYLCKKEAINILNKILEFPIGKKTYVVKVPSMIMESKDPKIYASFIRGFTDCDGCLNFFRRGEGYKNFKRKFNTYPRIIITSVSKNIIDQISTMLKFLRIKHTIEIKKKLKKNKVNPFCILVRGEKRLNQWIKRIGFKNPAKITKYQIWKKFGFCPPYTTIEERRKVLKGEVNPYFL